MKTRANQYLLVGLLLSLCGLSSSVSYFSPSYLYYIGKAPSQTAAIYYLAPHVVNTQLARLSTSQLRHLAEFDNTDAKYQLALRFLQQGNFSAAQLWWQTQFDSFDLKQQQNLAKQLVINEQWSALESLWKTNRLPDGDAKQTWFLQKSMPTTKITTEYANLHNFSLSLDAVTTNPICHFNVLMMADHKDGIAALQSFKGQYQSSPEPAINSFCFSDVVYVGNQYRCEENNNALQCDWRKAENHTWPAGFDFIVMMSKEGSANVQGGIMHINSSQSYAVFLHELMHFNGFEDEYPLPEKKQQWLCQQEGLVAPNLFIARNSLPPNGWQKSVACKNQMAYKPSLNWSIMQYQKVGLSEQYRQLWLKQINSPLTKPVRYADYFAFTGVKPVITTALSSKEFSD
ncbi:hypothetical protein EXT42_08935 [Pseudoalteromonas sp. CO302Y]|uniref:hypothetical protein n=1 Tax=unclassified Pseudoalteromonas TaxID=194690 RepID=UPI0010236C2C|nr:hypothetical protein EXT42_08935 [Pseudoalteromonas sp. CO302Y]RZG09981.1 hypothetical protein EXT40_08945 [Pseudoalteromonas sp. CO133X]